MTNAKIPMINHLAMAEFLHPLPAVVMLTKAAQARITAITPNNAMSISSMERPVRYSGVNMG